MKKEILDAFVFRIPDIAILILAGAVAIALPLVGKTGAMGWILLALGGLLGLFWLAEWHNERIKKEKRGHGKLAEGED